MNLGHNCDVSCLRFQCFSHRAGNFFRVARLRVVTDEDFQDLANLVSWWECFLEHGEHGRLANLHVEVAGDQSRNLVPHAELFWSTAYSPVASSIGSHLCKKTATSQEMALAAIPSSIYAK
jgi:hypothetical protein